MKRQLIAVLAFPLFALLLLITRAAAQQPSAQHAFSISAQPASTALQEFARQANVQLVYRSETVSNKPLNAVHGEHTKEEALKLLLRNAGLAYRFVNANTVSIQPIATQAGRDTTAGGDEQAGEKEEPPRGRTSAGSVPLGEVEEVIVTARKRQEVLMRVPETIVAISNVTLESAGIETLDDLGHFVPNLVLNRRQDQQPNVVMRGVGAFGNTQGVGFYVDEVQNFSAISTKLADIERVEVLKGPQGTLYGGSNIGGAIRVITEKPNSEFAARARLEIGQQETRNAEAAVNVPFGQTSALRVSGFADRNDGYLYNSFRNENVDFKNEGAGRLALRLGWDRLEALFSSTYTDLDRGGDAYIRTSGADDYRTTLALNEDIAFDRTVWANQLNLSWQGAAWQAVSVTSFTDREQITNVDNDYSADQPVVNFGGLTTSTHVTQEFRVLSDSARAWQWLAGVYGTRMNVDSDFTLRLSQMLITDDPADLDTILVLPQQVFRGRETEQYAAFGTISYQPSSRWELSMGLRANQWKDRRFERARPVEFTNDGTEVLPKISLAYFASPTSTVYGYVARGLEPGGVNLGSQTFGNDVLFFEPEEATALEVGWKAQLADSRASVNAALFYIDYSNRLFETTALVGGRLVEFIGNVGDSTNYGVEVETQWRITPRLLLGLAAGYLNSEWDSGVKDLRDVSGLTPPNSPKYSLATSAQFTQPIKTDIDLQLRADLSVVDSFYWDVANTARQDGYALLNLRAALVNETWELALRLENALDEEYNTEFYSGFFGPQQDLAARGQPRVLTATLAVNF